MAMPQDLATLEQVRTECQALIRKRGRISAVAAWVPIPGIDMVTDVAVFASVLEEVSARFGVSKRDLNVLDPATKRYVLLAAGRVGSDLIGRVVTRQLGRLVLDKLGARLLGRTALRFVPFAGQAVSAALSYRVVVHLGEDHIDDCYRVVHDVITRGVAQAKRETEET